jgi:hypothetical protein
MQRYFFDFGFHTHVHYDFAGKCFVTEEQAREMAEMIALDVACADPDTSTNVEVQVRNIAGRRLFSIPIPKQVLAVA